MPLVRSIDNFLKEIKYLISVVFVYSVFSWPKGSTDKTFIWRSYDVAMPYEPLANTSFCSCPYIFLVNGISTVISFHLFLLLFSWFYSFSIFVNPLNANTTKCSDTPKQFIGFFGCIDWVCLTILWDWHLKG